MLKCVFHQHFSSLYHHSKHMKSTFYKNRGHHFLVLCRKLYLNFFLSLFVLLFASGILIAVGSAVTTSTFFAILFYTPSRHQFARRWIWSKRSNNRLNRHAIFYFIAFSYICRCYRVSAWYSYVRAKTSLALIDRCKRFTSF